MSSRVSWMILEAIAEPIGAHIRSGAPKAVIIGSLAGLASGVVLGLTTTTYLLIPGAILGALIGAMVAASFVKAPPPPEKPIVSAGWMGEVLGYWSHLWDDIELQSLVVLCENAICHFKHEDPDWNETMTQLTGGSEPTNVDLVEYIPFENLFSVEIPRKKAELFFMNNSARSVPRVWIEFDDVETRDEFLDSLREAIGGELREEEQAVGLSRALTGPIITTILLGGISFGLYKLAVHWTANPPPPPRGEAEMDDLPEFVIWLGPTNFAYIGGAVTGVALLWAIKRAIFPPIVDMLIVRDEVIEQHSNEPGLTE